MAPEKRGRLLDNTRHVVQRAGNVCSTTIERAVAFEVFVESCGDASVRTKIGAPFKLVDTLFNAFSNSFNYELRRDGFAQTWV
ncbi:MAG: hypothetical protein CMM47_09595 [Rhodospirillaceae bacterium]|nr:hypothetical protein [Rhodospirillaceae bacterium]